MIKLYFNPNVYVRQRGACDWVLGIERFGTVNELDGYVSIKDLANDLMPMVDNISASAVRQMILMNCNCLEVNQ